VEVQRGAHAVTAYPALVDEGETVGVRVVPTAVEASRLTWRGARRLLVLVAGSPAKQVVKSLSPRTRLALQFNPDGETPARVDAAAAAAAGELIAAAGGPPRDEAAFAALVERARAELPSLATEGVRRVEAVLTQAREVAVAIGQAPGRRVPDAAIADLRRQMGGLLHRGFVADAGLRRLPDLVRYLRAMAYRLEKLPANAARVAVGTAPGAGVTAAVAPPRRHVAATGGARRPGGAGPLDDRGAAGGPVRAGDRHAAPHLRAADLQGHRRARRLNGLAGGLVDGGVDGGALAQQGGDALPGDAEQGGDPVDAHPLALQGVGLLPAEGAARAGEGRQDRADRLHDQRAALGCDALQPRDAGGPGCQELLRPCAGVLQPEHAVVDGGDELFEGFRRGVGGGGGGLGHRPSSREIGCTLQD
jgi:hypothetical protein